MGGHNKSVKYKYYTNRVQKVEAANMRSLSIGVGGTDIEWPWRPERA